MTEQTGYQLLISTFDDASAGTEAVSRLLTQFKGQTQAVPAVASVVKTAEGELAIRETSDLGAKQGAAAGALAGSLVGLLSRRRGVVGSAAVGALLGGVAAHKLDTGIPDPRLEAIGQALDNATSAAVAIVSDDALADVKGIVAGLGGATVIEAIDHKTDFMKQIQSGDYAGALAALGNQTEGSVSGASDSATKLLNDLLNRNKPA
jgi:uncharacterized membrane protein